MEEKLLVKKLFPDALIPKRATNDSAGYDLHSYHDYTLLPNSKQLIETGLSFTVPEGTYGQIAPRSGMSCKGTHIGAGVIDRDYTGHVQVLLFNLNKGTTVDINKGDRIAQLIIKRICQCDVEEVDELSPTSRGSGGFGSTGS